MSLRQTDVIVVGAGMVGLTLALAIKHFGMSVAVIDRDSAPSIKADELASQPFSARVSAISKASQHILQNLGVWEHIVRKAPYTKMQVWEDQAFGNISFDGQESTSASSDATLGHIIENNVLCAALYQQAISNGVQVFDQCTVKQISRDTHQQNVTVLLSNDESLQASLLVGADGGNSFVRSHFKFPLTYWHYQQNALVFNVSTEKPHQNIARQAFSKSGPLAFLPLADSHKCSIVWSQNMPEAQRLMKLDDDDFCKALQIAIDGQLGQLALATKRMSIPLKMQYVRQWIDDGIALVGDAAHTIHPLAGQGVNLGILDAASLAEQLDELRQNNRSIFIHRNLRPYERWRKTEALKMTATMEGFKQLFDGEQPIKKLVRNIGLSASNAITPLKQEFVQQALGSGGRLPKLAKL